MPPLMLEAVTIGESKMAKEPAILKFPCKEPGCPEQVEYVSQQEGGYGYTKFEESEEQTEVYLTCPRDHCHPYVIP